MDAENLRHYLETSFWQRNVTFVISCDTNAITQFSLNPTEINFNIFPLEKTQWLNTMINSWQLVNGVKGSTAVRQGWGGVLEASI